MSEWTPDLARLQALDDTEWLAVERAFCGRLAAYVARRIPDRDAREDVVQETFLGAVRGIGEFDPIYTFEQYVFGIAKNRTIDWLRRQKVVTIGPRGEDDEAPGIETLAAELETPSAIVRRSDLARAGAELLLAVLKEWVQETWVEGEFTRLMVVEALFAGGWRNRDTWERFDLRDETSVAGIKFRALKRIRDLARERDTKGEVLPALASALEEQKTAPAIDVGAIWREGRASCPARHWLARSLAGTLEAGPASYVRFHVDEIHCEWCQANLDDLARANSSAALAPMLERVEASTMKYLRSRTLG
ncbi:MAG TPA: sigma-70 family RNA polymerase sigma factor [Planctomycetota bacterium]|nr:sigma-70 family RNA polymerase sigma factor [Planctomycetota bacterium]